MAFFDSFTDSIKQKWLQFFQANREWITLQMTVESVYTPDGGKRPSSYLILGVINALEPKLAQLMLPFAKLNPDADTLIEVLNLHFDPDIALGNRLSPTVEPQMYSRQQAVVMVDGPEPEAESFSIPEMSLNELGNETQATWAVEQDDDGFGDISLSDESNDQSLNSLTSVGENPFGEIPDNAFTGLNTSAENGFDDVVSDIWGDETSFQNSDDN
jgi:hypothetical protein